jgi:hypothetical protein
MTEQDKKELHKECFKLFGDTACKDTYEMAKGVEAVVEYVLSKVVNLSMHDVSKSLHISDFHIGFEYLQYEMDSERYLNKGMIWVKKEYGFNSPRLHKIKELIDNGELHRCNVC